MIMNLLQQNSGHSCRFLEGYASCVNGVAIFRLPEGSEGRTESPVGGGSPRVAPIVNDRGGLSACCHDHKSVGTDGNPYRRHPGHPVRTAHAFHPIANHLYSEEVVS